MTQVILPPTSFPDLIVGKVYIIKDVRSYAKIKCDFEGEFKGFHKEEDGLWYAEFANDTEDYSIDTDFLGDKYYEIFEK